MKTSFDLIKSLNENALPKIKKTRILGENQENLKEYYKMKDDEHIIWDSEINYYDEEYMEEIKNNQYQDYLDNFEPSEPPTFEEWLDTEECYDNHYHWFEDSGVADGDWDGLVELYKEDFKEDYDDFIANYEDKPLNFEQWYKNYIEDSSYDDWEILEDDLKENIFPEIDKQINHNCLILSGNYGSNYPGFKPSGEGGKLFTGTDDFRNYMAGFDRVCITTQNGILGAICNDHDGTVSGQFYTVPEDLTELAQLMGYKEEESNYRTIADDLDQDLANEYLEAQQLTQFMDKLVPIKDTITAYSVNESEEHNLSKDLFGAEAERRLSQEQKDLQKDLQYVRDIMAGKEVIDDKYHEKLSLDTAKKWLRKDFVNVNCLASADPDDIDKKLAREYPDIFGNELDEEVIPNSFNMKCPKCGSSNYLEIDDGEDEDGTQHIILKCQDCGYEQKDELNESVEVIDEQVVSDKLTEVKSQGNVYMLQDNDKYIVGEDYNKEENLIENAEIYNNKEEADKDYFSRCDITRDGEQVDPTEKA